MPRKLSDPDVIEHLRHESYGTRRTIAKGCGLNESHLTSTLKRLVEEGVVGYDEKIRVYYLALDPDSGERFTLGLVAT